MVINQKTISAAISKFALPRVVTFQFSFFHFFPLKKNQQQKQTNQSRVTSTSPRLFPQAIQPLPKTKDQRTQNRGEKSLLPDNLQGQSTEGWSLSPSNLATCPLREPYYIWSALPDWQSLENDVGSCIFSTDSHLLLHIKHTAVTWKMFRCNFVIAKEFKVAKM